MLLGVVLLAQALASDSFRGHAFYYGDLHSHTGASRDAGASDLGLCTTGDCGALSEVGTLAQANGLDFVSFSDHANGGSAQSAIDFNRVRGLHDELRSAGVLPITGVELFIQLEGHGIGHKNLYLFSPPEELVGLTLEDMRWDGVGANFVTCAEIWAWMAEVEAARGPALLLPHHPGLAYMDTEWDCHTEPEAQHYAPAVELYSEHGSSESSDEDYDPPWRGADHSGMVHTAMTEYGQRLGFLGGTDSHDTRPGNVCMTDTVMTQHPYGGGFTVVVLDEDVALTEATLYDAIVRRQTYVTSGVLIPATVTYLIPGAALGGMGVELQYPEDTPIDVRVELPLGDSRSVNQVWLQSPDGRLGTLSSVGSGRWETTLDVVPAWVYPVVELTGDGTCDDGGEDDMERIWLSPTWFEPVAVETIDPVDTGSQDETGLIEDTGGGWSGPVGVTLPPSEPEDLRGPGLGSLTTGPGLRCSHARPDYLGGVLIGALLATGLRRRRA